MRRANNFSARAFKPTGRPTSLPGSPSCFAQRSRCSTCSRHLPDRSERRLARPGSKKAAAPCSGSSTCGAPARHGSSCATPGRGSPCAASGNGAIRRTGGPPGSAATTSGHGTASNAAHRCTVAPGRAARRRAAARDPPWRGCTAAACGHGAAPDAAYRHTIAAGHTAHLKRTPVATGAGRTARAAA
jgi:hypothetical protein